MYTVFAHAMKGINLVLLVHWYNRKHEHYIKLKHIMHLLFMRYSPGPLMQKNKKLSFDFAVALCSIGAPDMLRMITRWSEMENMVFCATPILTVGKLMNLV